MTRNATLPYGDAGKALPHVRDGRLSDYGREHGTRETSSGGTCNAPRACGWESQTQGTTPRSETAWKSQSSFFLLPVLAEVGENG